MKDPKILLEHILDSICYIESFMLNMNFCEFENNVEKQDAVERRLEIIGEAVKNLNNDLKSMKKDIPWRDIAAMRDILIHEYFEVSLKQVWNTVQQDLPILKSAILDLLDFLKSSLD